MILSLLISLSFAIQKGDHLPNVSALNEAGKMISLADYANEKYVLVYFYPKADSPGCTAQACSLRDAYSKLQKDKVVILGVSTDSVDDQAKFKKKYRLPFMLLSDHKEEVAKAFDVPVHFGFTSRQTFLFKEGNLVWLDRSASTEKQAKDVMEFLEKQK
ncbi:MAG: peroxiredoxin [Bdellovibrionales bacterium]|nr:peroxiredoxin [Bdellovibrionales bacterium]